MKPQGQAISELVDIHGDVTAIIEALGLTVSSQQLKEIAACGHMAYSERDFIHASEQIAALLYGVADVSDMDLMRRSCGLTSTKALLRDEGNEWIELTPQEARELLNIPYEGLTLPYSIDQALSQSGADNFKGESGAKLWYEGLTAIQSLDCGIAAMLEISTDSAARIQIHYGLWQALLLNEDKTARVTLTGENIHKAGDIYTAELLKVEG